MNTEFDVVVVGSGIAGLTTALAAVRSGLSAVVLEKTAWIGGASCWSYGALWVGANDQAAAAGIADDPATVATYMAVLGGGENRPERTAALIEHGPRVLRLFDELGISFTLMQGVGDILYGKVEGAVAGGRTLEPKPIAGALLGDLRDRLRTPEGDEWRVVKSMVARLTDPAAVEAALVGAIASDQIAQGAALVAALMLKLGEAGVQIRVETQAERLLTTERRVSGVALADGSTLQARRGVMLATGGLGSNPALVSALDHLPDFRSWFPEGSTGDGVLLAGDLGAAVSITRNNLVVMLGFDDPAATSNIEAGVPSVRDIPRAHTLLVNRAGERFGNEGLFQELAQAIRLLDLKTRKPRNVPCWMVFDTQYVRKWGLAGAGPGRVPDWVPRADGLDALAAAVGIDPAGLAATVARFNRFAETGIDEDYDRKPGWAMTPGAGAGPNPSLGSIAVAPFYAARLHPTLGAASGLRADASGRVMSWRGKPITGLYAAGDSANHDEFGAGYQAGITSESALVFAWLAVEDMLAGGSQGLGV